MKKTNVFFKLLLGILIFVITAWILYYLRAAVILLFIGMGWISIAPH